MTSKMNGKAHREDAYRRNEMATAELLVAHLRTEGVQLGDPRRGDPDRREPDAVCDTPEGAVGIECVNAYYDNGEAAWLWEMALEAEGSNQPRRHVGEVLEVGGIRTEMSPEYTNPTAALQQFLQAALETKCAKSYATGTTYLVLNARHAPLLAADEGPTIAGSLRPSETCGFAEIFLCLSENFTSVPRFFRVAGAP